ncbi:hypothetical protein Bpfe_004663 [Biomphalaria pfeifferi]|uniref:Uncharacterized protein n=1 Tax=Biomphalaria pfeifferi TaxID=112525 RepID=A0AAD8C3N6_BIOPF|nr:hypothetical protein Bpfe_004663 [Biomphalaria pfeifferi]
MNSARVTRKYVRTGVVPLIGTKAEINELTACVTANIKHVVTRVRVVLGDHFSFAFIPDRRFRRKRETRTRIPIAMHPMITKHMGAQEAKDSAT